MPGRFDVAFALLFALLSIGEAAYFWPRFRADADAGIPRTRTRAYRRIVIAEWLFAGTVIGIWTAYDRPWSALRLPVPHGWRLALGAGIVLAVLALMWLQLASVARLSVAKRVATRPKLAAVAFMLPRTREERVWFFTLAATAGFCEELLYRGYLPWFFAPWLGPMPSMGLAVVIFGLCHLYQGRVGAVKAMITGAVMAAVVLATGSLIPAMLFHALIDAEGGTVGYLLMCDDLSAEAEPVGASLAAH